MIEFGDPSVFEKAKEAGVTLWACDWEPPSDRWPTLYASFYDAREFLAHHVVRRGGSLEDMSYVLKQTGPFEKEIAGRVFWLKSVQSVPLVPGGHPTRSRCSLHADRAHQPTMTPTTTPINTDSGSIGIS